MMLTILWITFTKGKNSFCTTLHELSRKLYNAKENVRRVWLLPMLNMHIWIIHKADFERVNCG